MKFLVVDDEEDIRLLITTWLKRKGYDYITAVNGDDCITKLTKDIDIILLDIIMPGLKAKDVIDGIKKKNPNVRVIYLTSVKPFNVTQEQEKKGLVPVIEPPIIGYIEKPLDEKTFFSRIDDALKMKKFLKK
ncbi:Regulator of RpoS [Candidatus Tiddalikarchaeum anstoanum]|nr:Regulator of RpoS [Candidatus Tiddalikarchaeum anstoanum]